MLFEMPWQAFVLLAPAAVITFALSLIIGHFIAEPLTLLVKRVKAYRDGADVTFAPDGRLREADELSDTIGALIRKSGIQGVPLRGRGKRLRSMSEPAPRRSSTSVTGSWARTARRVSAERT